VVVDIVLTATAEVWKEPGKNPKDVKTEVFFIPAAPAAEKDGSLTNTMRLIQWHEKAVDPPGDVQTDAQFICTLAHRLQKMYAGSKKERGCGFAWPANRRILYNRASADLAGKPWSEKKKLIWWDPAAPGQKPEDKPGKWVGLDVPDFNAFLAPDAKNGDKPFIMRSDLVGG